MKRIRLTGGLGLLLWVWKGACRGVILAVMCVVLIACVHNAFAGHAGCSEAPGQVTVIESFDHSDGFEGNFGDEVVDGDDGAVATDGHAQVTGPTWGWPAALNVIYSHQLAFATKDSEVITNRSSLRCEFERLWSETFFTRFDGKAFVYYGNDHMAEAENKSARFEEKVRDFYVQTSGDRFMVKVGRQVVVWGETEADVVNDVVSPRDQTELFFVDLEEARVGQNMVSVELYPGFGDIFLFVSIKPGFNETPEQGTRYARGPTDVYVKEQEADFSDNEVGGKWKKVVGKSEIALMAASLLQNDGVLVFEDGPYAKKIHGYYGFYGIGANHTTGSFLFKMDASFKDGYLLQGIGQDNRYTKKQHDLLDTAVGMDYDANGRYTLCAEMTNRHIFDFTGDLYIQKRNSTGFYAQFNKSFRSDTLGFQYSLYRQLQDRSEIHKIRLDYCLSDRIRLILDCALIQVREKESFLWEYRDEDRVGAELWYYF